MAAEWDSSFQGEQKWVGENSFATGNRQDSRASAISERLPVPTAITQLNALLDSSDDKFVLGTYRFATVMTIGTVKSITDQDGTMTYTLFDPENEESEFVAVKYASDAYQSAEIVEGSRARVIGKLKGFDGTNIIMLFNISEVTEDKDYRIFELEAKAAKLFFEKDVLEKMKQGDVQNMKGMLAPPTKRNNSNNIVSTSNSQSSDNRDRIYKDVKPTGENSMEDKVAQVFENVRDSTGDLGLNVDYIMSQLQGVNMQEVKEAIQGLVGKGAIYETDDDHYALI